MQMKGSPRLSVAIPVHNEVAALPEHTSHIMNAHNHLPAGPHEIILFDDVSTDETFEFLEEAAKNDSRIVVIALSRNYGHQAALTAALDYVSGDAAIVMDGDLQDVPEAIPEFVKKYSQGYDVVYAQRIRRKEPWVLRLCYFFFYILLAQLSDVRLLLDSGDFGLISRRVLGQLRRLTDHPRRLTGGRGW